MVLAYSSYNEEQLKHITESIKQLEHLLQPLLNPLTKKEKLRMHKVGDKKKPFVAKALSYAVNDAEFTSSAMDIAEMEQNLRLAQHLVEMQRRTACLTQHLDDTVTALYSKAYTKALIYYNAVKAGARADEGSAKSIHDDLKQYFTVTHTADVQVADDQANQTT